MVHSYFLSTLSLIGGEADHKVRFVKKPIKNRVKKSLQLKFGFVKSLTSNNKVHVCTINGRGHIKLKKKDYDREELQLIARLNKGSNVNLFCKLFSIL